MADSTDTTPAGEEAHGLRCAYCPEPGADVCVREYASPSGGSGHSIHAHRACAAAHGDDVLYTLIAPTGRAS
jgi:hypothetical protein